jgi:hypothetical protein
MAHQRMSMVVLSLICEEPMHPYRMQALIKERGKELRAVTGDLRSGRLTWSEEWVRRIAEELASQARQHKP